MHDSQRFFFKIKNLATLFEHLAEIDQACNERMETMEKALILTIV